MESSESEESPTEPKHWYPPRRFLSCVYSLPCTVATRFDVVLKIPEQHAFLYADGVDSGMFYNHSTGVIDIKTLSQLMVRIHKHEHEDTQTPTEPLSQEHNPERSAKHTHVSHFDAVRSITNVAGEFLPHVGGFRGRHISWVSQNANAPAHTHARARAHTHTHTRTHAHVHAQAHAHSHANAHAHIQIHN